MIRVHSDLFVDSIATLTESGKASDLDGQSTFNFLSHDVVVEKYEVKTSKVSKILNLRIGKYTLVTLPNVQCSTASVIDYYIKVLVRQLKEYGITRRHKILVVGYGNRHITSDSLGAKVVGGINVGRVGAKNVYAIAPAVFGLTGIESNDIVDAVCDKVKPDLVLVIDSLCASMSSRLGSSFQITNFLFTPGSGVDNARRTLNPKCDSISIGVPLVVYSDVLVRSILAQNDIKIDTKNLAITNQIVTPKDIDIVVDRCAYIIACAINKCVGES